MTTLKNAAPRFQFEGFDDVSRGQPVSTPLAIPTHLPLTLPRTSWGPETDQIVSGDQIKTLYGDDIFDRRSPYFTHQNLLAEAIDSKANKQMMRRIVPDDAPAPSGFTLWIDTVPDDLPNYTRNPDNSYKIDANGNREVSTLVPTLAGNRVRLYLTPLKEGKLGGQTQAAGQLISDRDGTAGTAYPILELQRPFRGKAGDRGGIRLTAPTVTSRSGTRDDIIEDQRAMLYRMQFVERPSDRTSPLIKATIRGNQYVDFSFKEGVFDKYTNNLYGIDDVLLQAYNAKSTDGNPDTYGVFSDYFLYEENLKTVLQLLQAPELTYGSVGDTADDYHMVNFLTGLSYLGYPYYTIKVEGPAAGGLLFTDSTVHYAQGGGDGTLTSAKYEQGVQDFIDNFMSDPSRMWDPFRCPFSVVYDLGYTLPTKLKLAKFLGYRDDVYVVASTQTYGMPMNSEDEDFSVGVALKNEFLSYPESVLFGTGCCRAIIIGHAGILPAANVKSVVPLTYKFASDCAAYMGAGDGIWITENRPDRPRNNVVKGYTEINARAKSETMVDEFWNNGIVWAQYKDRRDQFVPAYQTVYEDDTSVLNSAFNMIIAVDIVKICRAVWTELVGLDDLTEDQFIQRSNNLIAQSVSAKYDGRVTVVPKTYFTAADSNLGYPWSCDVDLYMGNMKTVGSFTVRANRLGALAGTNTAAA